MGTTRSKDHILRLLGTHPMAPHPLVDTDASMRCLHEEYVAQGLQKLLPADYNVRHVALKPTAPRQGRCDAYIAEDGIEALYSMDFFGSPGVTDSVVMLDFLIERMADAIRTQ